MPLRSMVHGFRVQSADHQADMPFFTLDIEIEDQQIKFSEKTLLVPIVSAANVPQLAVDILIASLSLSRLGIFDSKYLVPVAGGKEDTEDGVTTPIELFGKEGIDIMVIQQRSPVLKSWKDEFISSLMQFVQEFGFESLLFLSGLHMTNRTDAQMSSSIFHLIPAASPALEGSHLVSLMSLPQYDSACGSDSRAPTFNGGGLTRRIFSSIPDQWTLPTGFLLIFVLEGDNRADATFLSEAIAKILFTNGTVKEWREPESWGQGLFGLAHDQILFG